jgi:hypothetical protein
MKNQDQIRAPGPFVLSWWKNCKEIMIHKERGSRSILDKVGQISQCASGRVRLAQRQQPERTHKIVDQSDLNVI